MAYYDPRADIIFRKIFGEHKRLCISLLNALLPLKEDQRIVTIDYLPSDIFPELPDGKNSIVDVRCTDQKGSIFIVEMQMYWTASFKVRALFNAAKAFSNQSHKGLKFPELKPVYCLCLLNENMPETKEYPDEYSHTYAIQHLVHSNLTIDGIKFVFVELPKFHSANKVHNKLAQLWLSFLTMMDDNASGKIPEELSEDADVSAAVECLREMSLTPEEKAHYDKYWDNISCEATLFYERYEDGKEKGREEGIAIGEERGEKRGIAIGKEKGREEGIAIGEEKGRKEGIALVAKKMKDSGLSISQIAEITGLSAEQIEEL